MINAYVQLFVVGSKSTAHLAGEELNYLHSSPSGVESIHVYEGFFRTLINPE